MLHAKIEFLFVVVVVVVVAFDAACRSSDNDVRVAEDIVDVKR
jgi:hypothetical protein